MKVKFNLDVNVNGAIHPKGSEEEIEGRLAETMLRNGWVIDPDKVVETESIPSVEPLENVVEMPKKKTYEDAVKRTGEKAVTVEPEKKAPTKYPAKKAAKKPAKKGK